VRSSQCESWNVPRQIPAQASLPEMWPRYKIASHDVETDGGRKKDWTIIVPGSVLAVNDGVVCIRL
jgi:hypothetical protein